MQRALIAVAAAAMLFPACKRDTGGTPPPAQSIAIAANDGCSIAADDYALSTQAPPLIVLLHAQGGSRSDWHYFAERAQAQGYRAIALDLRGHGESLCGDKSFRDFDAEDWERVSGDIRAAIGYGIETGADPRNVFVAGAGIGANLALTHALADTRVQAAVLISPGAEYMGAALPDPEDARQVPLLAMAAEGDSFAAAAAESLQASAPGYAEMRLRSGSAFGIDLLEGAGDPTGLILRWLQDIVGEADI